MPFEAPKEQRITSGFKAPDEQIISKSQDQSVERPIPRAPMGTPFAPSEAEYGLLERLMRKSEEARFPLKPEEDPHTLEFERGPNYPSQGQTTLGPSIDVAFAPFIARDVAKLGLSAGKAGVEAVSKGAAKASLKDIKALAKEPAQTEMFAEIPTAMPTKPIVADEVTTVFHGTGPRQAKKIMKEGLASEKNMGKGADKLVKTKGFTGKGTSVSPSKETAEAYARGASARKGQIIEGYIKDKDILDVSTDAKIAPYLEQIGKAKGLEGDALKQYTDDAWQKIRFEFDSPEVQGLSEEINTLARAAGKKGVSYPGKETLMFEGKDVRLMGVEPAVTSKPKPAKELFAKAELGEAKPTDITGGVAGKTMAAVQRSYDDVMLEPIQRTKPMPAKLPPNAENRIKEFETIKAQDIEAYNPLTSRHELNKKLGDLKKPAQEQVIEGGKLSNKGREETYNLANELLKFGFRPKTVESSAIQVYGESPYKDLAAAKLREVFGKEKGNKLIETEKWLRSKYDELLDEVNQMKAVQGEAAVAKRPDYFTHFSEMNLLNDLGLTKKIGTEEGNAIIQRFTTDVEALNASKFSRLKDVMFKHIKRQGSEAEDDAIEGFLRYASHAKNYVNMQPYVNELNATAKAVEGSMPNFATYLRNQADFIAGKKPLLDEAMDKTFGPDFMRAYSSMTQRMVSNLVQGNPRVMYSQLFGEVPTFMDTGVQDYIVSAARQMASPKFREFALQNSQVLQDRALDALERNLHAGPVGKQLNNAIAFLDSQIAMHSWTAKFTELMRKGATTDEAIKGAEEFTALVQSFTNPVNTPEMLRSKTVQSLAPLMNQALAYSRYMIDHAWKDKTLTEKTIRAFKMFLSGTALGLVGQAMFGEKAQSPLKPTNLVPMGGVLERGVGGPVIGSATRVVGAQSPEKMLQEMWRAGMLLQNKIPAGLMASRVIEGLFKEE